MCFFTYQNKDDPSSPSWRHVYTGGHDKVKWWKHNFHREATVIIAPAPVPAGAPAGTQPGMNDIFFLGWKKEKGVQWYTFSILTLISLLSSSKRIVYVF